MMMSEFIDRTGFEPTSDEYAAIEAAYYDFNGDKDIFCKKWLKDGGIARLSRERVARIKELEDQIATESIERVKCETELRRTIGELTEKLDRELEWKPATGTGTNMSQEQYERLAKGGRQLSDIEAAMLLEEECGFSPHKVKIIREVASYEVNKYHLLRKASTYIRGPVYDATDYNYIRFNAGLYQYEFVNGQLEFYCS